MHFRDQIQPSCQVDKHGACCLSPILTFSKKRRESQFLISREISGFFMPITFPTAGLCRPFFLFSHKFRHWENSKIYPIWQGIRQGAGWDHTTRRVPREGSTGLRAVQRCVSDARRRLDEPVHRWVGRGCALAQVNSCFRPNTNYKRRNSVVP